MAEAEAKDVVTSLRRDLTASEQEHVDALLDRAETLIRVKVQDLDERTCQDSAFSDLLVIIEAEAVARVFRNPEAYQRESEGDYSYTLNYQVASGLLDILAADWERLGVTGLRTLGMETDAYARQRYGGVDPAYWFQCGWPAHDQMAERWI